MILSEAIETVQVPKPIPSDTLKTLKLFQTVLRITKDFYHRSGAKNKSGDLQSLENFKKLKRTLVQYKDVPWVRPIFDQINSINSEYVEKFQGQRRLKKVDMNSRLAPVLQAWSTKNPTAIISATKKLSPVVADLIATNKDPLQHRRNPYYRVNPLFFMASGFINQFEIDDIDAILDVDLTTEHYSYLPLPREKLHDYQYIVYYMQNLTSTQDPITIRNNKVTKYLQMAYAGTEYEALANKVQEYLSSNDKRLIPGVLSELRKYPELVKVNNEVKRTLNTVYRGVGWADDDYEDRVSINDIVQRDRQEQFVAATTSKHVATNFALGIGHLESNDRRRNTQSYVITYNVGPESVLLDTQIFGGIFGESEILIDATKAMVEDVTSIDDLEH